MPGSPHGKIIRALRRALPIYSCDQAPNTRAVTRDLPLTHFSKTLIPVKREVAGIGGFQVVGRTVRLNACQTMPEEC